MERKEERCVEYRLMYPPLQKEVQTAIDMMKNEKLEPYYSYYTKWTPGVMVDAFLKSPNGTKKDWGLIPKDQYKTLLERFMLSPEMARIPNDIVSDWLSRIFRNTAQLTSLSILYGRAVEFPVEEVKSRFPEIEGDNQLAVMNHLHDIGFYKWASCEGPGPAWSDFGLAKLYLTFKEYREDMTPEEKLILINRCLDITHKRGKIAGFFLEGGVKASELISK